MKNNFIIAILQGIFSVTNFKNKKIIKVLGIKIVLPRKSIDFENLNKIKKLESSVKDLKIQNQKLCSTCEKLKTIIDISCDITACKPASGILRQVQKTRAAGLKLIAKILEENNITWWADYGTLIGAIRHKGFIPWDDDIDIAMLQEDYLRAEQVLSKALKGTDLIISRYGELNRSFLLRITDASYKFIYVDIFPYVCTDIDLETNELKEHLTKLKNEIFSKYPKTDLYSGGINIKEFFEYVNNLYKNTGLVSKKNCKASRVFRSLESMTHVQRHSVHEIDNIFPLIKAKYEDFEIPIPKNSIEYLKECDDGLYGDVMNFPPLEHIGGHKYAKLLKTNPQEVKLELESKNKSLNDLAKKLNI